MIQMFLLYGAVDAELTNQSRTSAPILLATGVAAAAVVLVPEHGQGGEGEAVDVPRLSPLTLQVWTRSICFTFTEVCLLGLGDSSARMSP